MTTTKDGVGCDASTNPARISDLVERARAGDQASCRDLFRLHVGRVHRTIYRLVGPSAEVEDLVQSAFIDAFRSLSGFRGEAAFSTWLTRIAVRVALRARQRAPRPTVPIEIVEQQAAGGGSDPDRAADARRGLARLDAILTDLSAKRRSAFVLHVLEGHPLQEVADMLGASVAAIKVRVHDARKEIERQARQDPWFSAYLGMKDTT